jgi:hypothetical protein
VILTRLISQTTPAAIGVVHIGLDEPGGAAITPQSTIVSPLAEKIKKNFM